MKNITFSSPYRAHKILIPRLMLYVVMASITDEFDFEGRVDKVTWHTICMNGCAVLVLRPNESQTLIQHTGSPGSPLNAGDPGKPCAPWGKKKMERLINMIRQRS